MVARQLELKQTLLEHPDVPKVIETVIRTALDDSHKKSWRGVSLVGLMVVFTIPVDVLQLLIFLLSGF